MICARSKCDLVAERDTNPGVVNHSSHSSCRSIFVANNTMMVAIGSTGLMLLNLGPFLAREIQKYSMDIFVSFWVLRIVDA